MPEFLVTEKWEYRVTFRVDAKDEAAAGMGDYTEGTFPVELSRTAPDFLDTLEVEPVTGPTLADELAAQNE